MTKETALSIIDATQSVIGGLIVFIMAGLVLSFLVYSFMADFTYTLYCSLGLGILLGLYFIYGHLFSIAYP